MVRLSDADKEILFDQLGRHAAAGRLDVDELERRVAAIDAAVTREEVSAVMADLPPLPPAGGSAGLGETRRTGPGGGGRGRRRGWWVRGHGEAEAPAPDWQPTNERFRDPRTQQVMRVWVDAAGGRHYVPEEAMP